jgi:hypothetical protein
MGYSRFDGNELDVMEALLKREFALKTEVVDYKATIKSLLRKKMIKSISNKYIITERGKSATTQQIRKGEYWVAPLKPTKWNPYGKAKISKELRGYMRRIK